jgi:LPXTG-site transpeptidase (sortase) family protein
MDKRNKLKILFLLLTAVVLLTVSAVSLGFAARVIAYRNAPVNYGYTNTNVILPADKNIPVTIEFRNLNIVLPITPAQINNGKWDDPKHTVSYWLDSPIPGDHGNSVMYGHNFPNILGNLPKTKKGDGIIIKYTDGQAKEFEVVSTYTVTADQKHILNPSDDARLTIYTCTGFLDTKRFVVVAIPK